MYLPIFREKLDALERQGLGDGAEAVRLRKALAFAERTANDPGFDGSNKTAA